ncbi:MAG: SAM-dependent methyltransferase [Thermoanaerobaculia bacterium]
MSERSDDQLRDVSDTALWVAAYRAEESERRDALFHDPFARRLAGTHGFELLDAMPKGRRYSWPMVTRTVLFDQFVLDRLGEGVDLVVNLAAGLDARPYRMKLPPALLWIEVDLPRMIDYKTGLLAGETPSCRLERIALDLADVAARRTLFAELGRRGERALVLTEGLLIYLERAQVEGLADDLAAVPSPRWWATDLASPGLLKRLAATWGKQVGEAGAPFRFAPEEGPAFFAAHGWRPREVHSAFHAAGRLKRLPLWIRPFLLLPQPKTFRPQMVWSGLLLLERG